MNRRIKACIHPLIYGLCVLLLWSCKDEEVKPSPQLQDVNAFIWEGMSEMYLWNDLMPQDIDAKSEFDPKLYFEKLLFRPTDRWSFITDDYDGLINSLKGIETSFGHNFKLFLMPGSNDVVGIVKYVVPNSPADLAGIHRGDKFFKVDGIKLTTSNYQELLFERGSYTLTFGAFDAQGAISPVEDKKLTAIELAENPILIHKTLDVNGQKIGYLSYNQFIQEYGDSLNTVFQQFKQDGVTDLVLDLRYNPGGSITTAILLSSMIAPTAVVENKEVYARMVWNDHVTEYIVQEEGENSDNLVSTFVIPEVNLNLSKVYILVSRNSASASELVINCLKPYMEVILVGSENTTGKYVGSITLHDQEANNGWAMQPIVLKSANADGFTDFVDGFSPDFFVADDFDAELGTLEEDMLAKSIELITGISVADPARVASSTIPKNLKPIIDQRLAARQNMYFDLN